MTRLLVSLVVVALASACVEHAGEGGRALITLEPERLLRSFPSEGDSVVLGRASAISLSGSALLVADRSFRRVVTYDLSGDRGIVFGREGEGPGELRTPWAVRHGPDASLWVLDSGLGRLYRFRADGGLIQSLNTYNEGFAVVDDSTAALPGGPDGAWVSLTSGGEVRPVGSTGEPTPLSSFGRVRNMMADYHPRAGLVTLDVVGLELLWAGPDLEVPARSVAFPSALVARAAEIRREREASLASLGRPVMISMAKNVHFMDPSRVWISLRWGELLGMALPLDGEGSSIAVIPSARREQVGLEDAILVDETTLVALYAAEIRVYRLRERSTPEWLR